MDAYPLENMCDNLSVILVHAFSCAYFASKFIYQAIIHAPNKILDEMVVLAFLLAAICFCWFCIRARTTQTQQLLQWEQAGTIILIAASTIGFVFFQFYFERWPRTVYMAIFTLTAREFASFCFRSPTIFPVLCLTYGILAMIPVVHASLWPSACRLPMRAHFISYLVLTATGGLFHKLRILERLTRLGTACTGKFLLHAHFIIAVILLWQGISAAYVSDAIPSVDQCREWKW